MLRVYEPVALALKATVADVTGGLVLGFCKSWAGELRAHFPLLIAQATMQQGYGWIEDCLDQGRDEGLFTSQALRQLCCTQLA